MERADWIEPPAANAGPQFHENPLLHALLSGRVATSAAAAVFLDTRPRPMPDPFALPGLAEAVARVRHAIAVDEAVAVYGDYDADGVTATALLVNVFRQATGRDVLARLPTRAAGYGLNADALNELRGAGVSLLIAVDCASSDHYHGELARRLGLDLVVLDHHQMEGAGPAGAIVASAQRCPSAPYKEMSAAGLAYLLAVGLTKEGVDLGRGVDREPVGLLDLAMLGTVGDVAPLIGPNRSLVRDGLRTIARRPRVGLRALCERAGVDGETLTSEQAAFRLVPRLNAAGRMEDPRLALDLLLTSEPGDAVRLASQLEALNTRRKSESERVVAEAEQLLRRQPALAARRLLVLARPSWGAGVLGLAASRLAERFGRPVVVLSDDGEVSRGSARSVPGFDVAAALSSCADLLRSHGGHSQAAGLTVASADVPRLAERLEAALAATDLPPPGPPALRIEADLPPERMTLETAELIDRLQPFGAGNPVPLLRVRDVRVTAYAAIGHDGRHLKLWLDTPRGSVTAVCWGSAERSHELVARRRIDLVGTIGQEHWRGRRRLQVEIKDFRPAE